MTGWDPAATALLQLLPLTGRGPRREGIFALWLTVRVAQDLVREPPAERAHRRRLQALEAEEGHVCADTPLKAGPQQPHAAAAAAPGAGSRDQPAARRQVGDRRASAQSIGRPGA